MSLRWETAAHQCTRGAPQALLRVPWLLLGITSTYARALQRKIFLREALAEVIDVSIKTVSAAVGRESEELRCSHGSCLARGILIVVGLVGVVASTQLVPLFFLEVRLRV